MGATHRVYRHRDKGTGLTPANGQSVRTVLSETTAPLVGSSCVFYRTSSLQRGGGALVPSASRVAPGPSAAFLHNWRKVTFRIQRLCVIRTILSTKNNRFTLKSTHSMASSTSVISGLRLHQQPIYVTSVYVPPCYMLEAAQDTASSKHSGPPDPSYPLKASPAIVPDHRGSL
jgi:hypothetical protein